jgi:hypothetical protein
MSRCTRAREHVQHYEVGATVTHTGERLAGIGYLHGHPHGPAEWQLVTDH